ncbi:MAG: PepSY domain-containing protein [Lachnospira sp.]|nr:PepSY domain-containing protein [Lachnospira sp.]
MKNKMVDAMSGINDKYLNEAVNYKPKKNWGYAGWMGLVALAACAFLILGIGMSKNVGKVDSVVALDINPSIELNISKHDKVLSVQALNEDAKVVLEGMDLKNVDLDTALNAIIGSLLKNGYLDEVYNAVNVCVENNDEERANELGEKFKNEIGSLFDENDLIGGVNSQFCSTSEENKKLAESLGVSVGKLGLAQKVSANTGMTLEEAVKLSVSELWDLVDAKDVKIITKEAALNIAIADAKVDATAVTVISNKIQEMGGAFTFAIKFAVNQCDVYSYEIDAVEGTIIEREYEYVPKVEEEKKEEATESESEAETGEASTGEAGTEESTTEEAEESETKADEKPVKQITKKEALSIAYKDAGADESTAKLKDLKHMPKEKQYRIEFVVGKVEYEYVINAEDGSIISKESEDKSAVNDSTTDTTLEITVSAEAALKLAVEKAGVELKAVTKYDIKYNVKKDGAEYKIHFHVGKEHYEYVINAVTGEITEKIHPTPIAPVAPVEPGDKMEPVKPVLPHEKEEAAKPEAPTHPAPVAPHEKVEASKPVGPHDTKVTISFEKKN